MGTNLNKSLIGTLMAIGLIACPEAYACLSCFKSKGDEKREIKTPNNQESLSTNSSEAETDTIGSTHKVRFNDSVEIKKPRDQIVSEKRNKFRARTRERKAEVGTRSMGSDEDLKGLEGEKLANPIVHQGSSKDADDKL